MTETFLTLLQGLLPAGGLGAVMVWLTSKTLRKLRTVKETHDTYKVMYEDLRTSLIQLQNDYTNIHTAFVRLEALVRRASVCRYYAHCPLRDELQRLEKNGRARAAHALGSGSARGQPASRRDCAADDNTHDSVSARGQSIDGDTDAEPP